MTDLSISAIEVPSLYADMIFESLCAFCPTLDEISPGTYVGTEVQLNYDSMGNIHLYRINGFIRKTAEGYESRAWTTLDKADPVRPRMAEAFMDIGEVLDEVIHARDFKKALNEMTTQSDEDEYFTLGILHDGFYIVKSDFQERIEEQSWDHPTLTQSMIDEHLLLISPEVTSSHERLKKAPRLAKVHEVVTSLYPVTWNAEGPLAMSFRPTPLAAGKAPT
jgi:hypothetical protein